MEPNPWQYTPVYKLSPSAGPGSTKVPIPDPACCSYLSSFQLKQGPYKKYINFAKLIGDSLPVISANTAISTQKRRSSMYTPSLHLGTNAAIRHTGLVTLSTIWFNVNPSSATLAVQCH